MVKAEVLRILNKSQGYVSGQEICSELDISRTAVWKVVKQLKEAGYDIEAIQNKGYLLRQAPDLLTDTEFISVRESSFIGSRVYYYDEVDSTNNVAKRLAEEGAPDGTLVLADIQKKGKGRRGREWSSPSKEGIYFSIILKPEIHPNHASMLTLVMAMAVTKGIMETTPLRPFIKWPNDIIINSKKVCGILTEMNIQMDEVNNVIIGVGINVHNKSFDEEIRNKATSLTLELENSKSYKPIRRAALLENIIEEFEAYYDIYRETEDLSALFHEYNRYLINIGRLVEILEPGGNYQAEALGINKAGALLVKKDDKIQQISSGEVSVRGICGYI